ncbi:phosphatase PAP2 family protein [Sphingobacterium sp. N143]|uniref:phosphatase PAP2 family protein n=1 Tax=Sphingobacterium sp. N143 TaxID=2746727 RepID=UPI0025778B4F|nr:phosphatase PAP2 family protein [Sphingobacterium sp. N143]
MSLRYVLALCCLLLLNMLKAQEHVLDTATTVDSAKFLKKVPYIQLAAPVALLSYGIIAQESHFLKQRNLEIRAEVMEDIDGKFTIDDFSQYAGTTSFFLLDAVGIEAKHTLKQRLFTAAVSHAIMAATVMTMKNTVPVWRPDSSAMNSFPSGHTATAFVGAELLWQEYRHQSIWYGIAGYAVATGTGCFRMYNNKHWLSDVAMGAGIGILSTKIAYWLLPLMDHHVQDAKKNYAVLPTYNGKQFGFSGSINF